MTAPALAADEYIAWEPNPGPQMSAMLARETEFLYGGAAGGGKSDTLLMKALEQHDRPGYRGLILRQTFPDLADLIARAMELYPLAGGTYNATEHRWTFPTGGSPATIEFGYFDTWKDHKRYRGRAFAFIGVDELGDWPEERFWLFLMSRLRTVAPGIRVMMMATANPGGAGHGWIKRRWLTPCGKQGQRVVQTTTEVLGKPVTLTRRFIPSKVTDNPKLLENNPLYLAQLNELPLTMRRQLLLGDWDAGEGAAFEEMDETKHFVPAFKHPKNWPAFGSFDWGYQHRFAFMAWTVNEDGRLYVLDTVFGRRLKDHDIADRIVKALPGVGLSTDTLGITHAGHDCWSEIKAREEHGPTTAERFLKDHNLVLTKANISRSDGYRHLMDLLSWRERGPVLDMVQDEATGVWRERREDGDPALVFCDTPGNREVFDTLQSLVVDPDHNADVLKVDADPLTGLGGDDLYDCLRYGSMSRPRSAIGTYKQEPVRAFDPALLKAEAERQRKGQPLPRQHRRTVDLNILHGGY